jgi:hypothetical protein
MRRFLPSALLCLLASPALAQDKTVPRFFELRDGTFLRLQVVDEPCPITVVRSTGRIEKMTVPLSKLSTVILTPEEDFARKQALLSAVQQLSADDFGLREKAQAALRKMGPAIRADLEACLQLTREAETQARLRALLAALDTGKGPPAKTTAAFDRLQLGELLWGYLGNQGIPVVVDGVKLRLGRKDVHAMTVDQPRFLTSGPAAAVPQGFARLTENDFPPGCVEESFERTPDGRPLQIGENIEKLFIKKGFVLSTSIATSYVSVNNYIVQGKSRGLSAATHQPLWEGEITITFVEPDHEHIPAAVSHFGTYIAAVMPMGTALAAYDMQGRELGKIHTEKHNTDFLGVRSSIPIHKIRIIPNVQIDRDYTLDDFIFMPVRASEFAHPTRCTVLTRGGERVLCSDVSFDKGAVKLHGLPAGLPDRSYPAAEVLRVNAPQPNKPGARTLVPGVFAELRDGSLLFATEPVGGKGAPLFARRPQTLKDRANLAGVWSTSFPRMPPDPKTGPVVVWDEDEKRWKDIGSVRFLEEVVLWKVGGEQFAARGYPKLTPLWLARPAAGPTPGSWHLRTIQGEDLVLAGAQTVSGQLSREVVATWQGQPLRVPAAEVAAIYQVQKEP